MLAALGSGTVCSRIPSPQWKPRARSCIRGAAASGRRPVQPPIRDRASECSAASTRVEPRAPLLQRRASASLYSRKAGRFGSALPVRRGAHEDAARVPSAAVRRSSPFNPVATGFVPSADFEVPTWAFRVGCGANLPSPLATPSCSGRDSRRIRARALGWSVPLANPKSSRRAEEPTDGLVFGLGGHRPTGPPRA